MLCAVGRAIEREEPTALQDTIDDRMGEILIVQDATPRGHGFVGREDHRTATAMPLSDDMEGCWPRPSRR